MMSISVFPNHLWLVDKLWLYIIIIIQMEECRVKNEEMEMRAINAEMKVRHGQGNLDSVALVIASETSG